MNYQQSNRVKIVPVDGAALTDLLRGEHHYRVGSGALPADAKIVDAHFDGIENKLKLLIESAEYPETTGSKPIQETIIVTTLPCPKQSE